MKFLNIFSFFSTTLAQHLAFMRHFCRKSKLLILKIGTVLGVGSEEYLSPSQLRGFGGPLWAWFWFCSRFLPSLSSPSSQLPVSMRLKQKLIPECFRRSASLYHFLAPLKLKAAPAARYLGRPVTGQEARRVGGAGSGFKNRTGGRLQRVGGGETQQIWGSRGRWSREKEAFRLKGRRFCDSAA